MKHIIKLLLGVGMLVSSVSGHADVYLKQEGNVNYYSDSYSAGAQKVPNNNMAGVTIVTDGSAPNTNVNYPTITPNTIKPSITLAGIENGESIPDSRSLRLIAVMQKLPNIKAVLVLDGTEQPIPDSGVISLNNLTRGSHTLYAKLYDQVNPSLAVSKSYTFTVYADNPAVIKPSLDKNGAPISSATENSANADTLAVKPHHALKDLDDSKEKVVQNLSLAHPDNS